MFLTAEGMGPFSKNKVNPHGMPPYLDWGPYPQTDNKLPDFKTANQAVKAIQSFDTDRPFFLSVGFHRPHVPLLFRKVV